MKQVCEVGEGSIGVCVVNVAVVRAHVVVVSVAGITSYEW